MTDLFILKKTVFEFCNTYIAQRIETIAAVLKSLEESKNSESKSSVGDKYETGRAMIQLEEEKNRTQLAEALLTNSVLEAIDLSKSYNKVEIGSFVITNTGQYFIAVGIGKIMIDKELIYGISLDSPIGLVLKDKKVGDSLSFNERLITIIEIV